jgi:hypothetical protein
MEEIAGWRLKEIGIVSNMDKAEEANNLLIGSIKAKLAILDNS